MKVAWAALLFVATGCPALLGFESPSETVVDGGAEPPDAAPFGFSFTVAPETLRLPLQRTRSVTLAVTRTGGFSGAIDVTVGDLPDGLTAAPLRIAADEDTATLQLAAAPVKGLEPLDEHPVLVSAMASDADTQTEMLEVQIRGTPSHVDFSFAAELAAGNHVTDLVVMADDRILVSTDRGDVSPADSRLGVHRRLPDGEPDTTFHPPDGFQSLHFCGSTGGFSVGLMSSGNVVVGSRCDDTAVVQAFNPAGAIVSTFGGADNGRVTLAGSIGQVVSLALADGHLLALTEQGELRRLDFSGSLAEDGFEAVGFTNQHADSADCLAVDGEGRIYVLVNNGVNQTRLGRWLEDGSPDASFGPDSTGSIVFEENELGRVMGVAPDGKVYVAGRAGQDSYLRVLSASGAPLAREVHDLASSSERVSSLVVDSEGRALLGAETFDGALSYLLVARFLPDATRDPDFGNDELPGVEDSLSGGILAFQADGRLLVGFGGHDQVPVLLRLWAD